jgi:MFS family permease
LIIWVASIGGALHAPVTTYYLLEVGATTMDVGWMGSMHAFGSLICGPIYGWMLDNKGPFITMTIAAFMCSAGCLIRGLAFDLNQLYFGTAILGLGAANLWTTVLAYLSSITDVGQRSRVVSAYMFQVTTLSLVGKALFPVVDWFLLHGLGVTNTLLRMRFHMSECTLFCFFGFAKLVSAGAHVITPAPKAMATAAKTEARAGLQSNSSEGGESGGISIGGSGNVASSSSKHRDKVSSSSTSSGEGSGGGGRSNMGRFALLACVMLLQAFSSSIGSVLWPLYLKDKYNWTQSEYAYVLFCASVLSIAVVAATPTIESALGRVNAQFVASGIAAVAAGLAWCSLSLSPVTPPPPHTHTHTHTHLSVVRPFLLPLSPRARHESCQTR